MQSIIRRKMIAGRTPGASLAFALVNTSTNTGFSPDVQRAIAIACEQQLNAEFADEWGGRYIVRVAQDRAQVSADEVAVIFQDQLPVAGALGYHDIVTATGKPIAYIALEGVTDFTSSVNALSVTVSHELMETAADPSAGRWEQIGDQMVALEVCDQVEDTGYVGQTGVWVSNFLFQSYFAPGSIGPYDKLGILTAQGQETPGGYAIVASMPPDVHTARTTHYERDRARAPLGDVGLAYHAARTPRCSKPPRPEKLARKAHPTSRTYARGVRLVVPAPTPPPSAVKTGPGRQG